jgi:hypothetical protein
MTALAIIISTFALLVATAGRDKPNLEIGGAHNPYMRRWYLIPRNPWFNIYLHNVVRDDDDRALHDHPWWNISILLKGAYFEHFFVSKPEQGWPLPIKASRRRARGSIIFRRATMAHRLSLPRGACGKPVPCWSLFITGPNARSWGFWCPAGRWVHWRDFTAGPRGELVGTGCGETDVPHA